MMRSFHVKSFRGFHDLKLEKLARVNLIAGMNNVGKTALLEAIFLHLGPDNPELGLRVSVMRGMDQFKIELEEIWGPLFYGFKTNGSIEIASKDEKNRARTLKISLSPVENQQLTAAGKNGKGKLPHAIRTATTVLGATELILYFRDSDGKANTTRLYLASDGTKRGLQVKRDRIIISPPGVFLTTRARFLHEDAERFSKLEATNRATSVLTTLQLLEMRLQKLALLIAGGETIIHGDLGTGRLIPLPLMGEGMSRLLSIVLAIANTSKGVVLIDEIENGLHYSVLKKVWQAIAKSAQESDTQIFATTHSWECIKAAHEAFDEMSVYDFALHRLDRVGDEIQAVVYDQEILRASLITDLEVR